MDAQHEEPICKANTGQDDKVGEKGQEGEKAIGE